MEHVVYALTTAAVGFDGGIVRLSEGDAWTPDHPFVRAHPDLFGVTPRKVNGIVEQATRAPGEQRGTRRPAKG